MDPANTTVKMVSPISAVRARCADLLSQLGPQLANPSSASSVNFESALQELEGMPESDASVELVDCLVAIAQYFYLTNIAARGLHAATRALDYSRALGDKHLIRRALSVKGVMLSETGNMPGAIEAYAEAIKVARTLNDPSIEAPVWVNLGAALMTSAQYSDAMECFVRAETLARSADPQHAAANAVTESLALANISNCALHLSDVRRGIRAARRAIELNPDPSTAHDCFCRVVAETNYSRLLLDSGELTHAAEHCESATNLREQVPNAALGIHGVGDERPGRCALQPRGHRPYAAKEGA